MAVLLFPTPWAVLRLREKNLPSSRPLSCSNPPPHRALPPFPNVSPASPSPTEECKLVPSNRAEALSVSMQHTQRRGKRKGESTPKMVKKGKKRGYSEEVWSNPCFCPPFCWEVSHRPRWNAEPRWHNLVRIYRIECGGRKRP